MKREQSQEEVVRNIGAEGQGVVRLDILFYDDTVTLTEDAENGDVGAGWLLHNLARVVIEAKQMRPGCMICEQPSEFNQIAAYGVFSGHIDTPRSIGGLIVCGNCARRLKTRKAIANAAARQWEKRFIGPRQIKPVNQTGSA